MRPTDQALWNTFVKNVTPLGQPEPHRPIAPIFRQAIPSRRIDLHGLSLMEAHTATMTLLSAATDRSMTVVTGISGLIKKEFPQWFDHMPHLRIEEMTGGGAFRLRKRKR